MTLRKIAASAALASLFALPAMADEPTGDAAAGEEAFGQCVACHVIVDESGETLAGRNAKTGPNLYGINDRAIGSVDGFRYGNGIEKANEMGLVWDQANFVGYVQDPTNWLREATDDRRVRGKMSFRVRSEEDALNLYAYISSLTADSGS